MEPILSIISPVYNAERFLSRLFASFQAVNLNEGNVEIIFIDDCSPDNSATLIKELSKSLDNVYLIIHDENRKAGGARNTGIAKARGKWLFFCDPDDEIDAVGFAQAINILNKEKELDVLMCDSAQMNGEHTSELLYKENSRRVMSGAEFFVENSVTWSPCCSFYRRSYIEKQHLYFEPFVYFEDIDWVLKTQLMAEKIRYEPLVVYHYIANNEGQCRTLPSKVKCLHWFFMASRIVNLIHLTNLPSVRNILHAHSVLAFKRGFRSLGFISWKQRLELLENEKIRQGLYSVKESSITFDK